MKRVSKGKIFKIKSLDKPVGFNNSKIAIEESVEEYILPEKLYGDVEKYGTILWNDFAKPNGKASALLVGKAGTGKTIFCKYISNIAIEKGVNVYILEGKNHSKDVIEFISTLNNCIIFIDEFGKQFSRYEQDTLLSLLTDTERKRMFLFTENYMDAINEFILNRPGRIKYNFDFDTLENDVIREYCQDNEIPDEIVEGLIALNSEKPMFCFDHMVAICSMYKEMNTLKLEEILKLLNVPCLRGNISMIPISIKHIESGETFDLYRRPVDTKGIIVASLADNNNSKMFGTGMGDEVDMKKVKEEQNKEKKFLERFKEDYNGIDIDSVPSLEDDKWDRTRRMQGLMKRSGHWVKVSLLGDNRLNKGNQDEIIYLDITGKYEVTFKRK